MARKLFSDGIGVSAPSQHLEEAEKLLVAKVWGLHIFTEGDCYCVKVK